MPFPSDTSWQKISITTDEGVVFKGQMSIVLRHFEYEYIRIELSSGSTRCVCEVPADSYPISVQVILAGIKVDSNFRNYLSSNIESDPLQDTDDLEKRLIDRYGSCKIIAKGNRLSLPPGVEQSLCIELPSKASKDLRKDLEMFGHEVERKNTKVKITAKVVNGKTNESNAMLINLLSDILDKSLNHETRYQVRSSDRFGLAVQPHRAKPKPHMPDELLSELKHMHGEHLDNTILSLKVVRDEFSGLKKGDLVALTDPETVDEIEKMIKRPSEQAKAMRWVLRGLSCAHAIKRVELESERSASYAIQERSRNS